MERKQYIALLLSVVLLLGTVFNSITLAADADTEMTETLTSPSDETETTSATAETGGESAPEESTASEETLAETTVPEKTQEQLSVEEAQTVPDDTYVPVILPEQFPSVTVTNPAPPGKPVAGPQKRQSVKSSGQGSDNLVLKKTVTEQENGTFLLTLESYATGTASVVTKVPVPSDVVLVLDESGSMNDCIDCGHEMTEDCSSLEGDCLHKIYLSELNTAKKYKTYYKDGTHRIVGYCASCKKWYTGGPFTKCSGHSGLGNWVAFSAESDKASYTGKVYQTQFYTACAHDTQRMDALKGAATNFLNRMYANSLGADGTAGTTDDVDNRIAIIGFDNDSPARIYTPKSGAGYVLADSAANAEGTLKSMLSESASVMEALGKVKVRSATATNRGMEAANLILTHNPVPAGQQRNRVVILFTDGSPGSGYENNKSWANGAIAHAYTIKQSHGATVYTIGLFWGADASDPGNLPAYDVSANGVNNIKFFRNGNRFLHLVSSNYPCATSLDNTGSMAPLGTGGSYYLSADNESGLYSIFGKLSSVVTPGSTTVTLDEKTVVKDVVTPCFDIVQTTEITAWTESYTGDQAWQMDMDSISTRTSGDLTISVSGNTVSVSNFDYAEHYVAADKNAEEQTVYRGKKLVIQIVVKPVAGFLGGDDILTNTDASAIYARETDSEPVKRFPIPDVDIPVRQIIPETSDRDIYVSQLASVPEILNPGNYTLEGISYETDTIRNAYVDIVYTVTDPEGKTITCTIPAETAPDAPVWNIPEGMQLTALLREDTVYNISCQVISVNNRENQSDYASSAEVSVYIPEIAFRDSVIIPGETADYRNNHVSLRWVHAGIPANTTVMGPVPVLEYRFDLPAGSFRSDTPVRVSITAKEDSQNHIPEDQNITPYVSFWREACSFTNCSHTIRSEVSPTDSSRINFVVHIRTFDLRIEKSGADLTLDPNSTFHFRVSGPNGYVLDLLIAGNGSAVIQNLPVGEYTVKELGGWSWRYEPLEDKKTIYGIHAVEGVVTVSFANVRKQDQWLDGEAYAENRFSLSSDKPEGGSDR